MFVKVEQRVRRRVLSRVTKITLNTLFLQLQLAKGPYNNTVTFANPQLGSQLDQVDVGALCQEVVKTFTSGPTANIEGFSISM